MKQASRYKSCAAHIWGPVVKVCFQAHIELQKGWSALVIVCSGLLGAAILGEDNAENGDSNT